MSTSAKVVADSVNLRGHRLTTLEVVMHRFVLAEFNTHRMFSRNSASSRAIPLKKQIDKVKMNIAYPVSWPAEQSGMQGGEELKPSQLDEARHVWAEARDDAVYHATRLGQLGVHKSVANRLLEAFMWHTVIVSSTDWDNFFKQRVSPLAQPEMREAAVAMQTAIKGSTPMILGDRNWHMPYVFDNDKEEIEDPAYLPAISAARCARVSYLTHEGKRSLQADLEMYERLVAADPPHASPLEHVAIAMNPGLDGGGLRRGNFRGYRQLRHIILGF